MTLIIFTVFLITTGASLVSSSIQVIHPIVGSKSNDYLLLAARTAKVPYNIFQTKKDFIKFAEQHIKNKQIYNYKEYKPHNPSRQEFVFDNEYVNKILNSLNLLHPPQKTPQLSSSTMETEIVPTTENSYIEEDLTSINTLLSTTEGHKNNDFENASLCTTDSITSCITTTTLLPTYEKFTTEVEEFNFQTTNAESASFTESVNIAEKQTTESVSISEKTTKSYEGSTEILTTMEEESSTIASIPFESPTITEKLESHYIPTTESIQPTTNLSSFDLNKIKNNINIFTPENNNVSIASETMEKTTELYDKNSTLNYAELSITEQNLNILPTKQVYEETTNSDDQYEGTLPSTASVTESVNIAEKRTTENISLEETTESYEENTEVLSTLGEDNSTTIQTTTVNVFTTEDNVFPNSEITEKSTELYEKISTPNSAELSLAEESLNLFAITQMYKEYSDSNRNEIYEATMPSSITTISYETADITTDSTNYFKPTPSVYQLSVTSPLQTTTENDLEPLTSENLFESLTTPEETTTEWLIAETVTEYISSPITSSLAEPIIDTSYETFEAITNIPFQEVTTPIIETTAINVLEHTTASLNTSTKGLENYNTLEPQSKVNNTTSPIIINQNENSTKLSFKESSLETHDAIKDRNVNDVDDFATNYSTTDYSVKSSSESTLIIYDNVKYTLSKTPISEKSDTTKTNRKSKQLKYGSDIIPTLGDYEI